MPSTILQHRSSPAPRGNSQPLAPSAFSGETRLRELEHLAETARRVRDQAAAELARQGSAHHIARDRIAAAERMLQKAEKEIAELRAELETAPSPASEPATSVQDFELAVLLGHSRARLNRAGQASSSFQLEQDKSASPRVRTAARTDSRTVRPATARHGAAPATRGHGLALGLLAALGVGLVIFGVYVLNGADAAPQAVRQTIGTLIPGLAGEHGTDKAADPAQAATAR